MILPRTWQNQHFFMNHYINACFFIYIHVHKYIYMYGSHHTAQATEFQAPSCLSLPSVRIMGMHYHAWSMNLKPLNLSDCLCTQEHVIFLSALIHP